MKQTSRITVSIIMISFAGASFLHSGDGICHRCEEIREYNKTHHQNYEYYEDYLREQSRACATPCAPNGESAEANPAPKNSRTNKN